MPKFKPQYRRLLFIDRKLRDGSYPNCRSMAEKWEVSTKTIQRDIEYLKYELDAPIEYNSSKHGFYYSEQSYQIPSVNVSESDLFAICIAERALKQFEGTPLHRKLSSVFDKIEQSLPEKDGIDPAWIDNRIFFFRDPQTAVNSRIWETIASAMRVNRMIIIRHKGPKRKLVQRKVEPYHLVSYRGEWYLSSYCHMRKSIRTFGVSRITSAVLTDEQFTMPGKYDQETMFGDQLGIIWNEKSVQVKIEFASHIAPFIEERTWHPRQKLKRLKNGGVQLEFKTIHLNEVKDWILSWGPAAKVLAPESLADKIRTDLQAALRQY